MKRTKFVHVFASMLVVFISISGCSVASRPAVTNNLDDLGRIRTLAKQAVQSAAEARSAQKLASELSDGTELQALMRKAEESAQNSRQYADEAASLQSKIDDLAARNQIADDVLRAQQAAEDAAAQRAAISRMFLSLRKQIIHSSMDDVTGRIVQQVDFNGEAGEQQAIKWLDEIVAGSYCDLLIDTVATGTLPTLDEVRDTVVDNSVNSSLKISGIHDIVSKELIDAYTQMVSGKHVDELEEFKQACETVLTER